MDLPDECRPLPLASTVLRSCGDLDLAYTADKLSDWKRAFDLTRD